MSGFRSRTGPVKGYLEYWLETVVKPNRAPKTYQGYELVVRLHIVPRIGTKKLRALTVRDVRLMCQHLAAAGMQRRGVQFAHAVLRAGLQNAMRDELVTRNVAKLVQVPAPEYAVGRGLSVGDAKKVLEAAKPERLHALYVVALYLGLRRGELLGLQWQHVDLDAETLQVVQSLQRVGGRLQVTAPKTASRGARSHCRRRSSRRSRPTGSRRTGSGARPASTGRSPAWCSPPASARRSSRTTSGGAGTGFARSCPSPDHDSTT